MTSYDKDIIARAAKGEYMAGGTLADYPELRTALRHENYELRGNNPPGKIQVICQMLLRDEYNDAQWA